MTDGDALYRAILDQPDDDAPRLVWADWLEEHGDPERATFVRLQCEWATIDPGDPREDEVVDRWRAILATHGRRWLDELDPLPPATGFWRGLPDWFLLTTDEVIEAVNRLRERVPAQCLTLELAGFPEGLRHWSGLDGVRCLSLYEGPIDPYYPHASLRGWVWLIQSPRLGRLRRFMAVFDVSSSGILAALAGTDWPELRELDLRVSDADRAVPHRAWGELADAPWFPGVRSLNLPGGRLGDRGAIELLGRGRTLALTYLGLADNDLTEAGLRRLTALPELRNLRRLVVGSGPQPPFTVDGVAVYT
jgi:uncharacterized protein (TIGR02996 family)